MSTAAARRAFGWPWLRFVRVTRRKSQSSPSLATHESERWWCQDTKTPMLYSLVGIEIKKTKKKILQRDTTHGGLRQNIVRDGDERVHINVHHTQQSIGRNLFSFRKYCSAWSCGKRRRVFERQRCLCDRTAETKTQLTVGRRTGWPRRYRPIERGKRRARWWEPRYVRAKLGGRSPLLSGDLGPATANYEQLTVAALTPVTRSMCRAITTVSNSCAPR